MSETTEFENKITSEDRKVIQWQLKTDTVYAGQVLEHCKYGFPSVVLLHPKLSKSDLNQKESKEQLYKSLSNFLWLTCPYLNKQIHDIESLGYIKRITGFITGNINFSRMMKNSHTNYYYLRKHIFSDIMEFEDITDTKEKIFNTGIGGIKDIDTLKCLHLHFAHFRIYKWNVVGRIVWHLLDKKIFCDEVICKNA